MSSLYTVTGGQTRKWADLPYWPERPSFCHIGLKHLYLQVFVDPFYLHLQYAVVSLSVYSKSTQLLESRPTSFRLLHITSAHWDYFLLQMHSVSLTGPHDLPGCVTKAAFSTIPVAQTSILLLMLVPIWETCHLFFPSLSSSVSFLS